MTKMFFLGCALSLPLIAGGCSSMMGDTGSSSTVSRDSQGAGAVSGASSMPGGATVGTASSKNPSN